jgi:hypothetical protein
MAMGWIRWYTQRGQIMTGSRSTSHRIISKEMLPLPTTTAARNSVTGTPALRSASPVSWRDLRWSESPASASPRPPRYRMRRTPAARAASAKARAASTSLAAKAP